LFAVSQIIGKNLDRYKRGGSALWINPEKDDCWQSVRTRCHSLKLFSQDYGTCKFLQQTGADIEFAAFPTAGDTQYDWIIL